MPLRGSTRRTGSAISERVAKGGGAPPVSRCGGRAEFELVGQLFARRPHMPDTQVAFDLGLVDGLEAADEVADIDTGAAGAKTRGRMRARVLTWLRCRS